MPGIIMLGNDMLENFILRNIIHETSRWETETKLNLMLGTIILWKHLVIETYIVIYANIKLGNLKLGNIILRE